LNVINTSACGKVNGPILSLKIHFLAESILSHINWRNLQAITNFMTNELEFIEDQIQEEFYEHFNILTDPKQTPIRIDRFLMDRVSRISRNKIQAAITAGSILVDNKVVKSNYKVRPNQTINLILSTPPRDTGIVMPEDIPLNVVYEDNDILVINKQAGLVVHPGVGNYTGTLINALAWYYDQAKLPVMDGNTTERAGLVHRIDKDTTGLLVIAKTEFAMASLSKQFFDHSIQRTYQALVWGQPDPMAGTVHNYIGRNLRSRTELMVVDDESLGKEAITHYKVLEGMYYVSLVECKLETGRTHQIRVHMKSLGHPLFNDSKYGGDRVVKGTVFSKYKTFVQNNFNLLPRQALHAKTLGFVHPSTKEWMQFDTDLPSDMLACMDRWRNYVTHSKDIKSNEAE